ncbi:DUF2975 domain-containing protein [Devosia sp.]|uniref:DUF2975 domain-containing protein n=1 Tax=Devosia sp. TaxID=1871048 RepID=UPI0035AFB5C4
MPDPHSTTTSRRLRRTALGGQLVAWGGLLLVVLFVGAALAFPEVRDPWLRQMGLELGGNAQLGALVAAIPAATFGYCLWQAGRLFATLRGADPFAPRAVAALVGLGWGAFATGIAATLAHTALAYLESLGSADGTRTLAIAFGSTELATLLVGILALAFALVIAEARRLEDDARGIV